LVDLFESYDKARTCERQIEYLFNIWQIVSKWWMHVYETFSTTTEWGV